MFDNQQKQTQNPWTGQWSTPNLGNAGGATPGDPGGPYTTGGPTPPLGYHYAYGGNTTAALQPNARVDPAWRGPNSSWGTSDYSNPTGPGATFDKQPIGGSGNTPQDIPGTAETWWSQHGNDFTQPGQAQQYWNGTQGFFANPNMNASESALAGYGNTIAQRPGAAENLYEQMYGQGAFTDPGAAEQFYATQGARMNTPGQGEQALSGLIGQYQTPGAAEDFYGQSKGQYLAPGDMETFYKQNINQLETPGYTEKMAGQYNPNQLTYNEQFLTGGGATGGLDAVYNRLLDTGSRQLNNQAAARGGFNSGASLRAQEELNKDITGQHVQALQAASTAADTSRLGQEGYGLNLMQGADTSLRGRLTTGGQLANESESAMLARLAGGQSAAGSAETQMLNRLQGEGTAAGQLDALGLQRFATGQGAATAAQNAANQRVNAGLAAANTSETAGINRLIQAGGLQKSAQDEVMQRLSQGGTLATGASNERQAGLTAGMAGASAAQSAQQQRQQQEFNQLQTAAQTQANALAAQLDVTRREQMQTQLEQLNGLLNQGKITSQQYQAEAQNLMSIFGAAASAVQAGKGGTSNPNNSSNPGGQPSPSGSNTFTDNIG